MITIGTIVGGLASSVWSALILVWLRKLFVPWRAWLVETRKGRVARCLGQIAYEIAVFPPVLMVVFGPPICLALLWFSLFRPDRFLHSWGAWFFVPYAISFILIGVFYLAPRVGKHNTRIEKTSRSYDGG